LKVDASSATEVNLNAGQNARYTFDGVAGSALQLLWTNNTLGDGNSGTNNCTYLYVYKPDGTRLIATDVTQCESDRPGKVVSLGKLPVGGTYRVEVLPNNLDAGQFKLHLRTANSGTALATDGTPKSADVADQELGYFKFTGVAGKSYRVTLSGLVFTPGVNSPNVMAYLYKPDGTSITSCTFTTTKLTCDLAASYFSVDGTYGLVFTPKFQNAAKFDASLTKL
ncbi:hypothetical protein AACH06_22225, partial [Ideonella sp. DXS29W]